MTRKRKRDPLGNFRSKALIYDKASTPMGRFSSKTGYPKTYPVTSFYGSLTTISQDDDFYDLNIDIGNRPSHTLECRDDQLTRKADRSTIVEIEDRHGVRTFDIVGKRPLNERSERIVILLRLIENKVQEFLSV